MTRNVNRRTILLGGAATAGGVALATVPAWASAAAEPAIRYPFNLGVASGDPLPDSVVLWTRLAPAPLNGDGLGGMPSSDFTVSWELASDEAFASIVASGTVIAPLVDGHSVHVIPTGLQPDAWYFYRFKIQTHISPVGRTRTAPALTAQPSSLSFAFASCQHFEQGWYHAHHFMAADQPDLVLWLGDYIYEGVSSQTTDVRGYTVTDEVDTLAQYRQRYAQHRTDPSLRAAHAAAPWVVVFDDHEVKNNWAGNDPTTTSPEPGAPPIPAARKTAAFKAWWENMPTRIPRPTTSAISAYRRFQWGTLARFHMLDTRQFRDDQAPDGNCTTMRSTSRTITGAAQEQWLLNELATPKATWDFLGQQVFFAQRDTGGDSADCNDMSTDSWDGYAASRQRITQGWVDRAVRNPVVLSGDVHRHWAANLLLDYYTGGTPVGTEFVGSSISTLGSDTAPDVSKMPHIRYIGNQRGYVRCTVTPGQVLGEWIGVSSAFTPNVADVTSSVVRRYAVLDGTPGLQPA
jgi:alkaline phosphatase D